MDKVKKGRTRKKPISGLPFMKIGRFLKKYQYPKRKPAASRSDPQYPLRIFPPYVQPVGYIPPACQHAIYACRALQLLEYAKNPARYNNHEGFGSRWIREY